MAQCSVQGFKLVYIDLSRNLIMPDSSLWEVFLFDPNDDDYHPVYTGTRAECLDFLSELPECEQETAFAESGLDRVSVC